MVADDGQGVPQAAHRLLISDAAMRTLIEAVYRHSLQEMTFASVRQVVTAVLKDPANRLFRLDLAQLHEACEASQVEGAHKITIRLDSSVNDLLRDFRDHAEMCLGRPVSVAEAIHACGVSANLA